MTNESVNIGRLILMPSLVTLFITVLRLVGELNQWSPVLFRSSAGGAGAIVGIIWLAFAFAIYFAVRLAKEGDVFESTTRAILWCALSIIACFAGSVLTIFGEQVGSRVREWLGILTVCVGVLVMRFAWPTYWKALASYALAARIPVLLVMYFAIKGNWNTHYDAAPPNVQYANVAAKFTQLALLPQLFFWVPITISFCGLFGILTAAILKRRIAPAKA